MKDDPYNEFIERNGSTYRYDPDYDCYYRVYTREELTHMSQFGWIYITLVLAAVCYYIEFIA
jgi:hypothetical protein